MRLAGVVVEGSARSTPQDLLPLYRADLGAPVDERFCRRVAAALRARYRSDGYYAPDVVETTLSREAGIVVVTLVEPRVVRVNLAGGVGRDEPELLALVAALKNEQPLARDSFRAWLAHANAIPGLSVAGSLASVRQGGAERVADLSVSSSRWGGVARIDNRVPDAVGHAVLQAQAGYRFATERADTVQAAIALADRVDRLRFAALAGSHDLDASGTTAAWNVSRSESRLPN